MFQKAAEELQAAFVQKRLTMAHEQSRYPRNRVRGRLPVELVREYRPQISHRRPPKRAFSDLSGRSRARTLRSANHIQQ